MGTNSGIIVRGAQVNNLKGISFSIPFNSLTVVTGVSGSGKSSLAFDLLYAEGQRRYIESLSAYARQFLERIEKPDVEAIEGIMPAIAIRQKTSTRNPRSTVATTTEVYDFMRLLFARIGETICRQCGQRVKRDTPDSIADEILMLPAATRFSLLFPVQISASSPSAPANTMRTARKSKAAAPESLAEFKAKFEELLKKGFTRLLQGTRLFDLRTPESLLDLSRSAPLYVIVDRLAVDPTQRQRLVDSIETCLRESGGEVVVRLTGDGGSESPESAAPSDPAAPKDLRFSERFECKRCNILYTSPEPQLFSFNNPFGACPRCQGFGNTIDFDLDLVIPDKRKSIDEGAIEPWTKPQYRHPLLELRRVAREKGIPLNVPYGELSQEQRDFILNGGGRFLGLKGFFQYLERKKYKLHVRVFLSRYRGYSTCPDCHGTRLRVEARDVKVGGRAITEINHMTIGEAHRFFETLQLSPTQSAIADKLLHEIRVRLRFLYDVGLYYITLDRLASTLSGGESQRIQLATS
ncbi:MAG: excinuclease ABC subunit A, partial [Acidobacteriia bacterium]|nr:excinuclease ABC subunit A [Terriglobia bacterium]